MGGQKGNPLPDRYLVGAVCVRCGRTQRRYDGPCAICGVEGVLDLQFDLPGVRRVLNKRSLARRGPGMWRYRELLPLPAGAALTPLEPGGTPLVETPRLATWADVRRLSIKDESRNPTGSLKDRASVIAVIRARAKRAQTVACASTGNAATSLAGAAASIGLACVIFVPKGLAKPKLAQLLVFGARVIQVEGTYDETWELCQQECQRHGWYNRNAAVNPSLIEGKKTAGLEIAEQSARDSPDWVAVPVGDGCTIAGVWKGLREMHALGMLSRLPRLLGVQAEGARPLVQAFRDQADLEPCQARTLADGIAVGHPRNWRKALAAVRESGGDFIDVSDAALIEAISAAGKLAGLFAEPAGAAGLAGIRAARERGIVARGASTLTLLTGSGSKDVDAALRASQTGIAPPGAS
jgi:threonine synthase